MVVVKDLMNSEVCSIDRRSSAFEAASMMTKKGVSCLIVTSGENTKQAEGIVTRRDVFEKVVVKRKDIDSVLVEEIMHAPVITVLSTASLVAASGIMKARRIKQLPVVEADEDGSVIGIITQTDIVANMNAILKFNIAHSYQEKPNV